MAGWTGREEAATGRVVEALSRGTETAAVCRAAALAVVAELGYDRAGVWLFEPGSHELRTGYVATGSTVREVPYEAPGGGAALPIWPEPVSGCARQRRFSAAGPVAEPLAGDVAWTTLPGDAGPLALLVVDNALSERSLGEMVVDRLSEVGLALARKLRLLGIRQRSDSAVAEGLRTVLAMADDLLDCGDVEDLYRRAVELARERLGIERCGLFVPLGDWVQGQWGTNLRGETSDERDLTFPMDDNWRRWFEQPSRVTQPWLASPRTHMEWVAGEARVLGEGWVVATPIQAGGRTIALMVNDQAISGGDPEPLRQDLLAVFCAHLGPLVERKRLEHDLRRSEARYRAVVDAQTDVICRLTGDGVITFANDAFCRCVGLPRDALLRARLADLATSPGGPGILDHLADRVAAGAPLAAEARTRLATGEECWYEWSSQAVPETDSGVAERQWVGRDITERKRHAEELRAAKEAAEAANLSKTELLANLSHELLTPLTSIVGMTDLAMETPANEEQLHCLDVVRASADWLHSMLGDLLDWSVMEAGGLSLDRQPFHLTDALWETLLALAPPAQEKALELVMRVDSRVPVQVVGDSRRLKQIAANLVANAIRYTAKGHVLLRVRCLEDGPPARLRLTVEDTGTGISPEVQTAIFEPFVQVATLSTPHQGGAGLGLPIVRRLATLMGGTATVESQPGQGSRFAVELTLDYLPGAECIPQPMPEVAGRRVSVLNGRPVVRDLLESLLVEWHLVPTGRLTEESWAAIVDTTCAGWRAVVATVPTSVPLILLQTLGANGDVALDRPVAARLVKPLRPLLLKEAFRHLAGLARLRPAPALPATAPEAGARVLVVEDTAANRELLGLMLQRRGFLCRLAADGHEALDAVRDETFDVILMDLQMPGLDGFETTALIRDREAVFGRRTPVVAITAHALRADRERCLAAGMDEYLTKPIRAPDLLAVIDHVLGAGRTAPA